MKSHRLLTALLLLGGITSDPTLRASDHADPMSLNVFQTQSDPAANITDLHAFVVDAKGRPLLTEAELKDADQLVVSLCVRRRLLPFQIDRLEDNEHLSNYTFRVHLDLNPGVRLFDPEKTRGGDDYEATLERLNDAIAAAIPDRDNARKEGMTLGPVRSDAEIQAQAKLDALTAERNALVAQHQASESTQRLYGGIIDTPSAIAEDAVLSFNLNFAKDQENSEATLAGYDIEGIRGEVNMVSEDRLSIDKTRKLVKPQGMKAGAINIQAGIFDDPFIFPRFFRSNVVGIVTSIPIKLLRHSDGSPASNGPILLWATTHLPDGKQSDHVGRSLRTQLPRFGYLNDKHPSQHVSTIMRVHDAPNLMENVLSTFLSPLEAHRHYDNAPDVMIYDLRKPAKFPNGRWLGDDVSKTLADAGETLLLELSYSESRQFPRSTTNDKEFRARFPYLAPRWTTAQTNDHRVVGVRFGDFDMGEKNDAPEAHDASIPGTKLTGTLVPNAPDSGAIAQPDFTAGVWRSLWIGLVLLLIASSILAFIAVRGLLKKTAVLAATVIGFCILLPIMIDSYPAMNPARPKQPLVKFGLVALGGGLIGALGLTALYAFGIRRGITVAQRESVVPLGDQNMEESDYQYTGSSFHEVRNAVFDEPYYGSTWGKPGAKPLPVHSVDFSTLSYGLFSLTRRFIFLDAARRTLQSHADLRWGGPDRKGVQRLLHPNGICLSGIWRIDEETPYTGYFSRGSKGLVIARYSSGLGVRRGEKRTLSMVGKLYPTLNPEEVKRPASFITQEDLGASYPEGIHDSLLRNAPNISTTTRGFGLGSLLLFGFTFFRTDMSTAIRQLYEIAELGKDRNTKTRCPRYMQLKVISSRIGGGEETADFRDEVLAQIYDPGSQIRKRDLVFQIQVSDQGELRGPLNKKLEGADWRPIGTLMFEEAAASYNGDFVIHFHHPKWRSDVNDPATETGPGRLAKFINKVADQCRKILGFFVKKK